VRRHIHRRLRRNRILGPPQTRHRLLLRVELDTRLAVEGVGAAAGDRLLVAGEGEHGQLRNVNVEAACGPKKTTYWDGNRDVDANLTGLNLLLEASSSGARAGEDGSTVAILVGIDHVDGLVDSLNVQANEDRTEDLFGVALHVRLDVGNNGGTNLNLSANGHHPIVC